jgi:hypothetical protein
MTVIFSTNWDENIRGVTPPFLLTASLSRLVKIAYRLLSQVWPPGPPPVPM